MDRLLDSNDQEISLAIDDLLKNTKGIVITNQLLDGTYHTQAIGEPNSEISFNCFSNAAQRNLVQLGWFEGQLLRLEYEGDYYLGRIKDEPSFSIAIDDFKDERIYMARLTLSITEEGSI
jgi:hypothetical protein